MSSLKGCVALVTGASSGIGQAVALALAAEGVVLHLVGRNQKALSAAAEEAQERGGHASIHAIDLELDSGLSQLTTALEQSGTKVDLLVHSAGLHRVSRWSDALLADFDQMYRINVRVPFALTQLLLPALIERQGQIVFINSSAGLTAKAQVGQYAATKHALKALADSLRDEVNPAGVRVISVYPGRTASPLQEALFRQEGRDYNPERLLQPEDVAAAIVDALRLPRTAEITDLHIRPFLKA